MVAVNAANNAIGPFFSAVIREMTACAKCLSSFNQSNKETLYSKELHRGWEDNSPPPHVNEQFAKDYASDGKQILVTYNFDDDLDESQLKTILFEQEVEEQEEVVMSGTISEVLAGRAKDMGLKAGDQVVRIDDWWLPPAKRERHAERWRFFYVMYFDVDQQTQKLRTLTVRKKDDQHEVIPMPQGSIR